MRLNTPQKIVVTIGLLAEGLLLFDLTGRQHWVIENIHFPTAIKSFAGYSLALLAITLTMSLVWGSKKTDGDETDA